MMSDRDEKGVEDTETSGPRTKLSRQPASPPEEELTLKSPEVVEDHELSFPDEPELNSDPPPASAMQTAANDRLVGTMVDGRYFVEHRIGEGGMGVVYACRHTIIDKRVAMKVLRSDMAKQREASERFLNEARSASSIGNAHIIDISDYGRLFNGSAYFVMEFLEGLPLVDIADEQIPQDPARVIRIAIQLTDGLAAAHRAGIIHRDLKPDNVFLVRQGTVEEFVKILDFGIAKATAGTSKLTQAGQIFGTPHYMSPEQADGARVDQRTDIYALGVMLYELCTGKLPFDAENYMAVLAQHIHRQPTPPSLIEDLDLSLPDGLERLILRCLEKSPQGRFQSMEAVGEELKGILNRFESAALPAVSAISRPGVPTPTEDQALVVASQVAKKKRSNLRLYLSVAAVAALLSGTLAWMTRPAPPSSIEEMSPPPGLEEDPVASSTEAETVVKEQTPPPSEASTGPTPPRPQTKSKAKAPVTTKKKPTSEVVKAPRPTPAPRPAAPPRSKARPKTDIGGDDLPSPW